MSFDCDVSCGSRKKLRELPCGYRSAYDLLVECPKCGRSMDVSVCREWAYCGFCRHEERLKPIVREYRP